MSDVTGKLSTALADRYRIESRLGEGGMATVYLAEDLKHSRKVALKVLKPELTAVLGAERFVQEIKTTANLQHPHILPLFDSGEADSFLYYVMPFIDGETLRDKLNRETQLGIDEAVRITSELADALDYAHRHNVIHRDIKPENILLHDGRPMVADFGIALAVSAAAGGRMTETGLSLGSPHYMSPEQATAEKDITNRSDIYSLGSVLYEMLTGEPPHTGGSAQAIIMKIVTEEADPVTKIRKSVPPHVAAATAQSLEKLAADRFESAKAFAEALANPAFTTATSRLSSRPDAPATTVARRVPTGVAWGIVVVMSIIAAWGWLRTDSGPPLPVSRYSVNLSGPEAWQGTGGIALSPDGRRLVYLGPGTRAGQLYSRPRDQLLATPIPGTESAIQPFFSPDGSRLAFFTIGPNALKIVGLDGGPSITIAEGPGLTPAGGSWGPDDYIYIGDVSGRGILRVRADGGGQLEPVTSPDPAQNEFSHTWPEVLPNGKGLLFTVSYGGDPSAFDIALADLDAGEHRVLQRGVSARFAPSDHLVVVTAVGTMLAGRFDPDAMEIVGDMSVMLEGMAVRRGVGLATADLTLSNDGTLAYLAGAAPVLGGSTIAPAGDRELVWVDRDGSAEEAAPDWIESFNTVELSPNGNRLIVSVVEGVNQNLWLRDLRTAARTKFTFEGSVNYRATFSSDGGRVMFVSNRQTGADLFLKATDMRSSAQLLLHQDRPVFQGTWAHADSILLFRTDNNAPGRGDILMLMPGDTVPVELVATQAEEHSPAISPDGRWMLYVSDKTGLPEVYVRPFPNVEAGEWRVSEQGGYQPRWAHSGREIFYQNATSQIVAAQLLPGDLFAVGERTVLFSTTGLVTSFNHPAYDVAIDDERFLMIRLRGGGGSNELIVVENFVEELKAKVGQ